MNDGGEGKHLCWLLNASCIPFSCLFSLFYCFSKSHVNITDTKQKQGAIPDVSRDMYIPVKVESFELLFALFYVPGTEVFYWVHVQLLSICYTDLTEGVNILSLTLLETFNPNYEMTTVMF